MQPTTSWVLQGRGKWELHARAREALLMYTLDTLSAEQENVNTKQSVKGTRLSTVRFSTLRYVLRK